MIQKLKPKTYLLSLLFLFHLISCKNVNSVETKSDIKLENKVENIKDLIHKLKKIENIKIKEDSVLNFKTLTIKDNTDKQIVEYWLIPTTVFNNQMEFKKLTQRLIISSCANDSRFRQFTWKHFTFYPYCGNQIENEQSILVFNSFENELIRNGAKLKHEYQLPLEIETLSESKKSNH
jgi:hypothetical protein